MKRLLTIALLLFVCCAKQKAPPPAAPAAAPENKWHDDSAERLSLLDISRGGTVIQRTGEAMLEVSALRAIDGEPGSFWMTPLHAVPQSMVIALPARTRIEKVGIRTVERGAFTANHVAFETSLDGKRFTPAVTIKTADSSEPQWFDLEPVKASYLRVTMVDSLLKDHDVRLHSILARGTELEPPHPGDITGCWSINGERARFAKHGNRVIGILESGKDPIRFDGGFDGRIYRLNWIRGNDYGITLLSVAPESNHLNALNWHEEAIPMFFDTAWFGEKQTCRTSIAESDDVPLALLRRMGRFSLYGDIDLGRILKQFPKVEFVAHEFRQPTPEQNRAASEKQLAALRDKLKAAGADLTNVAFVAKGSDTPREEPVTDAMRALYSTVDLEIRR